MKEISLKDFEDIRIGQAEDSNAGTGVTVLIDDAGFSAGLDVRGGGPALRESFLLNPTTNEHLIHAIVLAGGSSFGLDASGGVQKYLEELGVGYPVGCAKVPLVCQADIFDLGVGDPMVRPGKDLGYEAAKNSEKNNYKDGCYGAGTGATVGKYKGIPRCMKSGVGSYAVQLGDLKVGALVVVNAYGDIYDPKSGEQIAGLLSEDGKSLMNTCDIMYKTSDVPENLFVTNTTIGIIMTNATFEKPKLCKIAGMAHNGYARTIRPVHTSADGDSIYAVATNKVNANIDLVGTLAADVMATAIVRAVKSATSAYGRPSYNEIHSK